MKLFSIRASEKTRQRFRPTESAEVTEARTVPWNDAEEAHDRAVAEGRVETRPWPNPKKRTIWRRLADWLKEK